MINADVTTVLGETDIYLIDQIMKGRYKAGDVLLDAGCGKGRNLHWFLRNGFEIYAIDANPLVIDDLVQTHPHFHRAGLGLVWLSIFCSMIIFLTVLLAAPSCILQKTKLIFLKWWTRCIGY